MTLQGLLRRGTGGGRAGPEPVPGAKGAVGWPVGTGWPGWGSGQDGNPTLPTFAHPGCCQAFIWEFPFASGMGLIFTSAS